MKIENLIFKNKIHEFNYRFLMNLIKEHLRSYTNIQAVVYLIALMETNSAGASKYIFDFVEKSLEYGFFDNPNTDRVADSFANRLWNAAHLAFEEDFFVYVCEAVLINLFEILNCGKPDFIDYMHDLLNKNAEKKKK